MFKYSPPEHQHEDHSHRITIPISVKASATSHDPNYSFERLPLTNMESRNSSAPSAKEKPQPVSSSINSDAIGELIEKAKLELKENHSCSSTHFLE